MHAIRRGDDDAFEALYDRHATVAYSLAYRMTGVASIAQDVVQEAFLSAWRSQRGYDVTRGSVRSWLLGIVHHRAIDALRRNAPHDARRASDEGLAERLAAPDRTDTEVARREEAHEIQGALRTLPADQARVIELAYFGGYSHSEIAAMLDIPVGTIKGRMRLGLQKLRAHLTMPVEVIG